MARANGDAEAEADALRRISQWGEGGRNKVLLHGLTGAAVAALSGGDISGAAAGAAGSELAKDAMIRFLTGQGMDPRSAEFNSLIELASAALGGVVGGVDGAATALLGDQFNRQMHWDQYLDALDACKGNPGARGCSTILEMSENTNAVVISNSSDEVAYKVIANQNKDTGETVSFTLTEADGTPRIIMQRDEYNDFVMSAMPPPFWGMSPGYALDFGSYFSHGMRGKFGEAFGDVSNIFTSGEYWRDLTVSMAMGLVGMPQGRIVPASLATARVGLRENLAGQAGIPRNIVEAPANIWGKSIDSIERSFKMDGATLVRIPPKAGTSGNAKVYRVDGGATGIKEIQYSPSTANALEKSTHVGEYYKITYFDGSKAKVIDPLGYRPKFRGPGDPIYDKNTIYLNPQGLKVKFNPSTNTWIPE